MANELEQLHQIAQSEGQDPPIYGKSRIVFSNHEARGPRKVKDVLHRSIEAGIFHPRLHDYNYHLLSDPGNNQTAYPTAFIHELTGISFVSTSLLDGQRYFVHTRVITPGKNGKYQSGSSTHIPIVNNISVVSGPCLFSSSGVEAIDVQGVSHPLTDPGHEPVVDPIESIRVDKRLQPYEADSIMRLTSLVSSLNPEKDITVRLNIPRIEYWFYALSYYESGLMSREVLLDWFDQVNQRSYGIEKLMRKRIPHRFKIDPTDTLATAESTILNSVEAGKRNLFGQVVEKLRDSEDWAYAIDKINPETFQHLDYISYTIPYLQEAKDPDRIVIATENPEEIKIIESVQKLLGRSLDQAVIMGFYPHSNILLRESPQHGGGRRFLYFYQVPENKLLDSLKTVVEANRP